ncbi:MAG: amidohydrolase family protein [Ignavibacteriae bacterium]|nr:amidohydrolase family protein [Ignavibacteriota bacterium]
MHVHAAASLGNLRLLERNNIVKAILITGSREEIWRKWVDSSQISFIPSPLFPNRYRTAGQADSAFADQGSFWRDSLNPVAMFVFPDTAWIRKQLESKTFLSLGEITTQYWGVSPTDQRLEPYFSLAEQYDIPIGIHMALAPPNETLTRPTFRARLGNPLLLEDILVKHPKLRIWVMHAGHPYLEEMTALMLVYTQVYVDISAINYSRILPRQAFHQYLKGLIDAGLGKRIMFGSDFTQALEETIEAINSALFLSEEQKRDILYNNAARFLRLPSEEIARHNKSK